MRTRDLFAIADWSTADMARDPIFDVSAAAEEPFHNPGRPRSSTVHQRRTHE